MTCVRGLCCAMIVEDIRSIGWVLCDSYGGYCVKRLGCFMYRTTSSACLNDMFKGIGYDLCPEE